MLHGGIHRCRDQPFTYSVSHKPKISSNLDSSDQRTDFHRSNVHCSCFLFQASLFILLLSFSSVFFAAFRPWRPDSHILLWTVDVSELYEAFICDAISEAGSSNELILCSRSNSGSSFPVVVLMRANFIIVPLCVLDCHWRIIHSSWHFPVWLTIMS